ncbi:MAG: response regulator [Pseudomonadota bacterium]
MLRKILFVDDDQILRCAVEKHLETYSEHFLAVVASDGFDAVKKLKKMPFSLVVLDLIMPRMDGMSLLSHIREHYPDIPVVIISSMPVESMQQLAAATDVVAYHHKPFQVEELVTTIMNVLREEAKGGIMHDVSPAVFLQFMEMDGKTCTIRILDKASKQGGILYFIDGQLVDARISDLRGMDAALKAFTWDAATIFLRNDCPPREDIINSGLQPIIMKAAGMRDESDDPVISDEDDTEPSSPASATNLGTPVLADPLPSSPLPSKPTDTDLLLEDIELDIELDIDIPPELVESPLDNLKNLLEKKAGIQCSPDDIYQDASMEKVALQLSALGTDLKFGDFQVGYIVTGKACDRILLPGTPPILVNVPPNCPKDRITELLHTDKLQVR